MTCERERNGYFLKKYRLPAARAEPLGIIISRKRNKIPKPMAGDYITALLLLHNQGMIRVQKVSSSTGGHTGEMVRLLSALDFRHFSPRLYLVARTDDMSAKRVQQLESSHVSTADSTVAISRSREVHQSWISTILCNGPGTCVPPCVIALLLRTLFIKRSTIVFVESICRVTTLSLTGKLMLYILADRSIVQWPELHAKYPQTVFLGRLV
ncbi:hypothetical protein DAPPUDRAFT_239833 [Daphnia pulex]|uniref:UDP-N-acetylglucosamine transferase subunit ALG14 n=1 Tax=Daphnia pulex TaxID=6669 RepID=E9GA63_DAPPU|nr:hypothetical protein DAPPUDRAFT_239833 [Daphnia pulex]|eukprot:EFX83686.1 hypothetical protein DAPPUDRAFT_239833 [Daphnia pulex]